jgi:hypothetical protein
MKHSAFSSLSVLSLLTGTLTLAGCGGAVSFSNPVPPASTVPPTAAQVVAGTPIQGSVYGGHAPIQGSHVYLLQPGITGYGSAATSLITTGTADTSDPNVPVGAQYVLTDSTGSFNTGDYSCTVGRPVYIYAWGGTPGGTINNNNIVELATLGNCPSSGNFYTAGTGNGALQYIYLNEVSTVATAYTFQPFTLVTNNDAWHIGTTNTTQGLLGIANAANTAGQLYNIQGGAQLSSSGDGEGHLANYQTQNGGVGGPENAGNGVVPEATIDSLANILADCVDSVPTAPNTVTSQCAALFKVATNDGTTATAGRPVDTGTAAMNIARFPAGNNSSTSVSTTYVHDIYTLQGTGTTPYVPQLTAQPHDWTLPIYYPVTAVTPAYGTAINSTLASAESIAVDDLGQIWISAQDDYIERYSPMGALQTSGDYLGYIPGYVSVDGQDNAWTGNANCGPGTTACPTGTGIFQAGSNGVFNTTYGSGYEKAYTILTNNAGDAFFFANTATNSSYEMYEYGPGGTVITGSPFNLNPTSTTTTTTGPGPITITAATETNATKGGVTTYTYTFDFANVGTPAAVLAVGDPVTVALTNDPGTGTVPTAATGWGGLTSLTVATVNSTTAPTSFTATGTVATTNTVSTDTNGTPVVLNITSATETNVRHNGVTTYTYTFGYAAPGGPPLKAGDTVALALANAGGGFLGTNATGWQNLTSATVATVNSPTNPSSFTATGTIATTNSADLFGDQGNGATGTGTYYLNGATGTGTFTYSTTTTTTTPGALPAGVNVAHGAIASDGHLWITAETPGNTIARIGPTGVPDFTSIVTTEQPEFPAIDNSGNAWIAIQQTAAQIDIVSPTGGTTVLTSASTGAELTSTFGAAVDGNGNVWFANRNSNYGAASSGVAGTNSIVVINGGSSTPGTTNTAISPLTNYVPEAQYPAAGGTESPILNGPLNVAIDPSGNVWITNYAGGGFVELVGAAAPVVTPLSVAAGTSKLGAKP